MAFNSTREYKLFQFYLTAETVDALEARAEELEISVNGMAEAVLSHAASGIRHPLHEHTLVTKANQHYYETEGERYRVTPCE